MRSLLLLSLTLSAFIFTLAMTGCGTKSESTVVPASEETATGDVNATPVSFANTRCPIMGGKPTSELTAQYEGETIGFCCEGCPEKWAELSEEEKAEKFAKVAKEKDQADGASDSGDHSDHDHSDHADADES